MVWNLLSAGSGQQSLLRPLPTSCPAPAHWLEGQTGKIEKALVLCKHGSARAETLVCYQHCFDHQYLKHSMIWAAIEKINSIPSPVAKKPSSCL